MTNSNRDHGRVRNLCLIGTLTFLVGCGNLTSGGFGEVEVVLTSDEVAELQEAARSMVLADAEATSHGSTVEGTLTVRVRSYARRGPGDFVELTDGVQEVTVSLSDPEPVEIARRPMPTGSYDAVRTFFGRIEANIESGLVIDGIPIIGTVPVDLSPTGTLSVVTLTGFEVVESTPTVVAIEMQSRVWLRLVDAVLRRVDLEDFRRVLRVRVRLRSTFGG
jgi:hypothetical protein